MYVWRRHFVRQIVELMRPTRGPHLPALSTRLIYLMEGGFDFYAPYEEPTIIEAPEFGSRKPSE
jgi:hypothetical protein